MTHDQLLDAYIHLINVSSDKRTAVDRLFWRAFEMGLDAGVDLERGDVELMTKDTKGPTYITDLEATYSDEHLSMLKSAIKKSFPNV